MLSGIARYGIHRPDYIGPVTYMSFNPFPQVFAPSQYSTDSALVLVRTDMVTLGGRRWPGRTRGCSRSRCAMRVHFPMYCASGVGTAQRPDDTGKCADDASAPRPGVRDGRIVHTAHAQAHLWWETAESRQDLGYEELNGVYRRVKWNDSWLMYIVMP